MSFKRKQHVNLQNPLKQRLPWGITSQYLMFFLLTSVLPMLILSLLFFKSGNDKLNERMNNELDLGILLAESVYENDMKRLALATQQSAMFSIGREYQRMETSGNNKALRELLDKYRELRDLDIVTVLDTPKQVEARSGFISYKIAGSYNRIIQAAFNGETVATVEAFQDDNTGKIFLAYLSAAPIIDTTEENGNGSPIGVLVTGRSVSNEYSFSQLLKMLPKLDVRIVMQVDEHLYEVLSASDSELKNVIPEEKGLVASGFSRLREGKSTTFQEQVNGKPYKSKAAQLRDYTGKPVGYIIVSTSEADFANLRTSNLMFIAIYLFIGLGIVGLTGLWFQKTFIKPIDELSHAFTEVAEGHFDNPVNENTPQPEMHHMLSGFNTMLAKLKETDRLRDTFISSLTHDLRTPVTAQKRVLETLAEMNGELDPEVAQITSGLLKNNEQLLDMINKLLEASQYEAGSIRIHPEPVQLHQMVAACCAEMQPIALPKHIAFKNDIPENFPVIEADSAQLRRVFINLMHNAVENIGQHKVVTISAQDNGETVTLLVADNGPGLPDEILSNLFERYFTGHKTRQKIGSGLGLFICRMIVQYHGGQITAQSQRGKGTSFYITLPKASHINVVSLKRKRNKQHV